MDSHPSFRSLDQAHFIATGEHLPPRAGDACPMPVEHHIQKTLQRQQRQHAWTVYIEQMRGPNGIVSQLKKKGSVNGVAFDSIEPQGEALDENGQPSLALFNGSQKVMELWADGRELVEPTPAASLCASPVPRFQLRAPWALGEDAPSPIVGIDDSAALSELAADNTFVTAGGDPTQTRFSRLRRNFMHLLHIIPDDALWAEYEEWQEEVARAHEHLDAVMQEIARRGLASSATAGP